MAKKKAIITNQDEINIDIGETFLNLINGNHERIDEDFTLKTNKVNISALNPKKGILVIKEDDPDRVKRAQYIIQLNAIGCQICQNALNKTPTVILMK